MKKLKLDENKIKEFYAQKQVNLGDQVRINKVLEVKRRAMEIEDHRWFNLWTKVKHKFLTFLYNFLKRRIDSYQIDLDYFAKNLVKKEDDKNKNS